MKLVRALKAERLMKALRVEAQENESRGDAMPWPEARGEILSELDKIRQTQSTQLDALVNLETEIKKVFECELAENVRFDAMEARLLELEALLRGFTGRAA